MRWSRSTRICSPRPRKLAPLNAKRADVLEQLAAEATDAEELTGFANWPIPLAQRPNRGNIPKVSTVCPTGRQAGGPKGSKRPCRLCQIPVPVRDYTVDMQQEEVDFAKIQDKWLDDLGRLSKNFRQPQDSAEAMLHLALAEEFAGNDEAALNWYRRVDKVSGYPQSQKAVGAKRRIESVGKPLVLSGKDRRARRSTSSPIAAKWFWSTTGPRITPIACRAFRAEGHAGQIR